jgi:ABC-type polysaccharide/polyol phosphate transport system ATPase subunit
MDDRQIAIKVDKVGKVFKLPHEKNSSIKSALINLKGNKRTYEKQQALKDISFEIKKGEFFGIVGRNGSGKSTLLKLLAGIYHPTGGNVTVNGQLTPFIELGVGFNPELTGRENVYLNGALLGFSRKEMRAMYKDIVEFAEIEKFMDQKLKNYSSGMHVRLAFSIAVRAQSDILLIDEVLAVGDSAFQQKCYDVFDKLKAQKQTIVFVSHDMSAVRKYCNRAVLIDNGDLVKEGSPQDIAQKYEELNQEDIDRETVKRNIKNVEKSKLKIKLASTAGSEKTNFKYGEDLLVQLSWPEELKVMNAGVAIYKQSGEYIFGTNTLLDKISIKKNSLEYSVNLSFGPGRYFVAAGLFGKTDREVIEFVSDGPSFSLKAEEKARWEGLINLNHKWGP